MRTHTYLNCIEHGQKSGTKGYGSILVNGKTRIWHRVVYCKHHSISLSEIDGLVVRHICDNPRCINPEHLVIGTQADNVRDKVERGRHRSPRGEASGKSKLTEEMVLRLRREYVRGSKEFGTFALARKYGLSQSAVHKCIVGNTWSHL